MKEEKQYENPPLAGDSSYPECFGDGERVCPEDEEGIMQPQQNCLPCPHLRPCVQTALHRRGKIRLVDAPATKKVAGFFKRWSENKLANMEKRK